VTLTFQGSYRIHFRHIPGKSRIPFLVKPMLATLVAKPFHAENWVYQEKYDGDRLLAYKQGARTRLLSWEHIFL